jgi:hypothetical protein
VRFIEISAFTPIHAEDCQIRVGTRTEDNILWLKKPSELLSIVRIDITKSDTALDDLMGTVPGTSWPHVPVLYCSVVLFNARYRYPFAGNAQRSE